jgi:murein DD-endopeptidase MepM/ murein hydrolase activator NlpD
MKCLHRFALSLMLIGAAMTLAHDIEARADAARRENKLKRTGLIPRYPADRICPPITSFYASWDDVDGTRRREPHSGVDAGGLGDIIIAPAPGTIIAAWKANWGWGDEGALLIRHSRAELGLASGPEFYFSEFDHMRFADVEKLHEGSRVDRGQSLGIVSRPGGNSRYLPEVHWEVWQVDDADANKWSLNELGTRVWKNKTAHLVDPLYMLSLNARPHQDGSVDINVFDPQGDYRGFKGFTYIFPCPKRPD